MMHFKMCHEDESYVKYSYHKTHTHSKEHKEICGEDEYVYYLDNGDGITGVRICTNSSLKMCKFLYVSIIPPYKDRDIDDRKIDR